MVHAPRPRSSALSLHRPRLGPTLGRVGLYCWLGFLAVLVIAPLYWLVRGSFGNTRDFYSPVVQLVALGWPPRTWPPCLDWSQFQAIFRRGALLQLRDGVVVAVPTTALTILLAPLPRIACRACAIPGGIGWPARFYCSTWHLRICLGFPCVPRWPVYIWQTPTGRSSWRALSFTTPFCTWMLSCYFKNVLLWRLANGSGTTLSPPFWPTPVQPPPDCHGVIRVPQRRGSESPEVAPPC
jgi:hypothetical protein